VHRHRRSKATSIFSDTRFNLILSSSSYSLDLKAKKKHLTANERASLKVSYNRLHHRMRLLDDVQMAYIPGKSGLAKSSAADALCTFIIILI
jgi:hypothetical protein